mgnify:CR=1 FL=1
MLKRELLWMYRPYLEFPPSVTLLLLMVLLLTSCWSTSAWASVVFITLFTIVVFVALPCRYIPVPALPLVTNVVTLLSDTVLRSVFVRM